MYWVEKTHTYMSELVHKQSQSREGYQETVNLHEYNTGQALQESFGTGLPSCISYKKTHSSMVSLPLKLSSQLKR